MLALSKLVGCSEMMVSKIETSQRNPPSEARLSIWLASLGASSKLPEALRLLRSVKRSRRIVYFINDPINEHLDRILDAYENHRLKPMDKDLLSMIGLQEYVRGEVVDPHIYSDIGNSPMAKNKGTSARSTAAAQLGSKGGQTGGPARAKKLSSLERSEVAKKGGVAKAAAVKKKMR